MSYVSTGQVARLLSVTPDTVLKWIKKGKLPAIKTAGGHYRIPRNSLDELLNPTKDLPEGSPARRGRESVPCWEYNAVNDQIKDECRSCLVFKAQGTKCYEVGKFLKETGYGGVCCPFSCEECAYYKDQLNRTVNVLIFTDSETLKKSLTEESELSRFSLRFTSCEYNCSFIVDSFRPEFVVVDCAMESDKCRELCEHLAKDPRIPGVKIALAVPQGKECGEGFQGDISVIPQPFTLAELETHMDKLASLRMT